MIDRIKARLDQLDAWSDYAWSWLDAAHRYGIEHPATLGALLAVVSEVHECECRLEWSKRSERLEDWGAVLSWSVWCMDRHRTAHGPTKLDTLVMALEAPKARFTLTDKGEIVQW